jgi:HEAT repeat protein
MKRHLLLLPLLLITTAASAESVPADGLFTWRVPVAMDVRIGCSNHDGMSIMNQRGSGAMVVIAKMRGGKLTNLRAHDIDCAPQTGAEQLALDTNASIDFLAAHLNDSASEERIVAILAMHDSPRVEPLLERMAGTEYGSHIREQAVFWLGQRGGEAGFRFLRGLVRGDGSPELRKKAVFAISQSEVSAATQELIDIARNHKSSALRREAIFWLGQKAGEKAAAELRRAVDEDPDDDVREHAVFAISQLPRDRAVPLLIDLVKNHKSPRVREKAMFWLAQTNDPRALDVIEEILTH